MKPDINFSENSVDPDQLASSEASGFGATLFQHNTIIIHVHIVHNNYGTWKQNCINFL